MVLRASILGTTSGFDFFLLLFLVLIRGSGFLLQILADFFFWRGGVGWGGGGGRERTTSPPGRGAPQFPAPGIFPSFFFLKQVLPLLITPPSLDDWRENQEWMSQSRFSPPPCFRNHRLPLPPLCLPPRPPSIISPSFLPSKKFDAPFSL